TYCFFVDTGKPLYGISTQTAVASATGVSQPVKAVTAGRYPSSRVVCSPWSDDPGLHPPPFRANRRGLSFEGGAILIGRKIQRGHIYATDYHYTRRRAC